MKYFLSIIVALLVSISFFSNVSSVSAGWFTINHWWWGKVPYCNDWECWLDDWIKAIEWVDIIETTKTASQYIQDVVKYLLWFLMLISVILIIYSWVVLLTWVWDEEKAKKTKKIILYAILGLIIIFLAYPITDFIFKVLNS
jgi:hypothetical protein